MIREEQKIFKIKIIVQISVQLRVHILQNEIGYNSNVLPIGLAKAFARFTVRKTTPPIDIRKIAEKTSTRAMRENEKGRSMKRRLNVTNTTPSNVITFPAYSFTSYQTSSKLRYGAKRGTTNIVSHAFDSYANTSVWLNFA
jgi:hypothetical protein